MVRASLLPLFLLPAAYAQLHTLAVAAGLKYFGTATDNNELSDAPYVALLSNTSDFGQITPGNGQKWDSTERSQGVFSFEKGDEIVALAAKNSQLVRCHTLVWHAQLPSWVSSGSWTRETIETVMKNHITELVTHYKGKCYSWDVVNEALDNSATTAVYRDSPFYKAMGEDFIRIAFETARAADAEVKLYYNDYNIEYAGAKADNALTLITKLVQAGTPIDGVGAQGHYISGKPPSKSDISSNLAKYTALGLEVAITELDVRIQLPSSPEKFAQQALDYASSVQACLDVAGCVGVTVWDFTDKYSWIPSVSPGDGAANIMDENLNKKPAYDAIAAVLGGHRGRST
ncbi:glycoside hydrolase family 10 protein [Diplocarpon rosae]|nr:glycoside hydrolase family 10 protein [Diplocarpon rosae]